MKQIFSIGDIVYDLKNNKKYRIVAMNNNQLTLCEMETKKFVLSQINTNTFLSLLAEKELTIVQENDNFVVDKDNLSNDLQEKLKKKKDMMLSVLKIYGPDYMGLSGRKQKPELDKILEEYGCPRNSFWRICCDYFQSGFQDYVFLDSRLFSQNEKKNYNYTTKTGRPTEYSETSGVALTDEIRGYFEEALKDYKSGRHNTIRGCFDKMNLLHFMKTEIINGKPTMVLMSESERPTYRQFYYFMSQNLTNQEKDLIKTSALEQRNNKRLIVSDSLFGVKGPGDLVEIDACEADISLVSMIDENKTVGRPIVYFMIDVYSRVILAMSVAFDNNSVLGLTNLFLNLADNKKKYCERYGISFENEDIWFSNVIPNKVRVDRGAEFKSKEFERICNELGIERIIVPPASGSLKGVVEQSFHQLHLKQNNHLENKGLIEKRHGSKHHQKASLNIEEYTKLVIGFVLTHNQQCLTNYPVTKEMIENKVKPIPALLWKYGCENLCTPRPITSIEQYLYNLMTPIKAKVSRRGISHKDLWYLNTEDKKLAREMFDAGTKKVPFEARMDMRDVGAIYYIRDNKLNVAKLNPLLNGNSDYSGLTMKQYEDYLKGKKELLIQGRANNEELSAFNYALNATIVQEAEKTALPEAKNMRPARELEKQAKSKSNRISKRLNNSTEFFNEDISKNIISDKSNENIVEVIDIQSSKEDKPISNKNNKLSTYDNWDDALEDW